MMNYVPYVYQSWSTAVPFTIALFIASIFYWGRVNYVSGVSLGSPRFLKRHNCRMIKNEVNERFWG